MSLIQQGQTKSQLLLDMQCCIEELYDLDIAHNVTDFVTSNCTFAKTANRHSEAHSAPEQLYVMQDGEYLDISLYLDHSLLNHLTEQCPFSHLHTDSLSAFWIILEGVSHFCYLAWNAAFDRAISRLEMELQAEIDKFICTSHILHKQNRHVDHEKLWKQLFKHCCYDENLNLEQRHRYVYANHYASLYCSGIRQTNNDLRSFKQIRRFYRLRENEKIRFISLLNTPTTQTS